MWEDRFTNQQLSCRNPHKSPSNTPFTVSVSNLLDFQESDCNDCKLNFPDEVDIQRRCFVSVSEQESAAEPNRMQRWRFHQLNVFLKLLQMSLLETGLKTNLCLGHTVLMHLPSMSQLKTWLTSDTQGSVSQHKMGHTSCLRNQWYNLLYNYFWQSITFVWVLHT